MAYSSPVAGVQFKGAYSGGASPAVTSASIDHTVANAPTVGTAAGNEEFQYSKAHTVTNGVPLVLDVTALTDPAGNALNFGHVTGILVSNGSSTAAEILTVGGGSNPLIATWAIPVQANGGAFALINPNPGIAVSGTVKTIQITVASGTNVPIKVSIKGRST